MEFYYMDRPSVPSTQQISVNISGITEHGVKLKLNELCGEWLAKVVEVKNSEGVVVGSLLYVECINFENLVLPHMIAEDEQAGVAKSEDVSTPIAQECYDFLGETVNVEPDTADVLDHIEGYINEGNDAETDVVTVPMSFLEEVGKQIVHLQRRNNNQYEMLTAYWEEEGRQV